MATLSMDNSNIIGISYSKMNSVKVSMKRSQQMLETSQRNLSTARVQLQVDRGRLRITEDSLSNLYSEASKRKTKIDKICNNIDYTVRRFKEVDSRCAASIRSIAKYYNSQVSIVDRIKNSILGIGKYLFNGFTSLLEEGANAFDFLKTKASEAYNAVSEFMEAHPWIGNTIGVIGGIGQMGVYALLLTPPFTPIGVAGMAFGFNSAVYSGTKLINNITNGSNEGINVLENVFSLFGDGGKTAYNILDMGFAIATIPIEGGFALSKASQIVKESNGAIKGLGALSKGIKEVEKMKVDKLSSIINSTLGKVIEPMSKVKVYLKNSFGEFFNFKSVALPEGFSINISKIDDVSDSSKVVNKIGQVSENVGDYGKVTEEISKTDKLKINSWKYAPDEDLYLKYKDVFDNPKYYNQTTGEINWPGQHGDPNIDGFLNGEFELVSLKPGKKIDRYGGNNGTFFADEGIPTENRAMAPNSDFSSYNVYEIKREIPMRRGEIAQWFDEVGGGIQYQIDPIFYKEIRNKLNRGENFIDGLIRLGYLKRL